MSDYFLGVGFFLLPAFVVCAALILWSRWSVSKRLSKVLRASAIFWFVALALIFHFFFFAIVDCEGNALYGYSSCGVLPVNMANASLAMLFLGFAAGVAFGVILSVVGGIIEWWLRRAGSSNDGQSAP